MIVKQSQMTSNKLLDFPSNSPVATTTHSKEDKSATAFDLITFFCADLIQSEDSWILSSTFDWLTSAQKNVS